MIFLHYSNKPQSLLFTNATLSASNDYISNISPAFHCHSRIVNREFTNISEWYSLIVNSEFENSKLRVARPECLILQFSHWKLISPITGPHSEESGMRKTLGYGILAQTSVFFLALLLHFWFFYYTHNGSILHLGSVRVPEDECQ